MALSERARDVAIAWNAYVRGVYRYLDGEHQARVRALVEGRSVGEPWQLSAADKVTVVDELVFSLAERWRLEDAFRFADDAEVRQLYGRISASTEAQTIFDAVSLELKLKRRDYAYHRLLSGMLGLAKASGKATSAEAAHTLDEPTVFAVQRARREIAERRPLARLKRLWGRGSPGVGRVEAHGVGAVEPEKPARTGQEWAPLLALTGAAVFIGGLLAAVVWVFQWEPAKPPHMGWPACTEDGQRGCVASVGSSLIADTVQSVLPRVSGATSVPTEVLAVYNAPFLEAEAGLFEKLKVIVPVIEALPTCPRADGGYVVSEVTEPCVAMPRVDGGSTSGWHLIRWLESVGQDPQLLMAVNPGLAHRRFADGDEAKVIVLPPDMAAWIESQAPGGSDGAD